MKTSKKLGCLATLLTAAVLTGCGGATLQFGTPPPPPSEPQPPPSEPDPDPPVVTPPAEGDGTMSLFNLGPGESLELKGYYISGHRGSSLGSISSGVATVYETEAIIPGFGGLSQEYRWVAGDEYDTFMDLVYSDDGIFGTWVDGWRMVLSNAGEPGARFDYLSYGEWSYFSGPFNYSEQNALLVGYTVFGIESTDVPTTGSANYTGTWTGALVPDTTNLEFNTGARYLLDGPAELTADFATAEITGQLYVENVSNVAPIDIDLLDPYPELPDDPGLSSITINASYNGTMISGSAMATMYFGNPWQTELRGRVAGNFYGPAAAEVGGVFELEATDGSASLLGAFAAEQ